MSLAQKTIRETSGSVLLSNLTYGIRFGTQILLARYLTPEIFGVVALATAVLTVLNLLSDWGVNVAIVQERGNKKELEDSLFTLSLIYSAFALFVFSGALFVLKRFYSYEMIKVASFLLLPNLFGVVSSVSQGVMQRKVTLIKMDKIKLGSILVASAVGVVGALRGWGVWSLASFYGLEIFVASVGFLLLSPYTPRLGLDKKEIGWFFSFSGKIFKSSILERVLTRGDDLIVGSVLSPVFLGFYNIAWKLVRVPHTVAVPSFNKGILASFSKKSVSVQQKASALNFIIRVLARLTLPFYSFLFVFSPEILRFFLGGQWLGASSVVRRLVPWGITLPFFALYKYVHLSLGRPENLLRVIKFMILLFFPTFFLGTFFYGLTGAALSLGLVYFLGVLLLYKKTKKTFEEVKLGGLISISFSSFMPAIIIFLIKNIALQYLSTLSILFFGGGLYVLFMVILLLIFDKNLERDVERTKSSFI